MTFFILFLSFCVMHSSAAAESPQTIWATPAGGSVFFKGSTIRSEELGTAIKKARSGDSVVVLPGTYDKKIVIQKKADPDQPITIQGVDDLTIFACGRQRQDKGDPAIKLELSKGIRIKGIRFEKCWPAAVEINESEFITIAENQFVDTQTPNIIKGRSTRYILLESNVWTFSNSEAPAAFVEKNSDFYFILAEELLGDLILRHNKFENSIPELMVKKPAPKDAFKDYPVRVTSFENHGKAFTFALSDVAKINGPILLSILTQDNQTFDASKCEQMRDQILCHFKNEAPSLEAIHKIWFRITNSSQLTGWGSEGEMIIVDSIVKKRP